MFCFAVPWSLVEVADLQAFFSECCHRVACVLIATKYGRLSPSSRLSRFGLLAHLNSPLRAQQRPTFLHALLMNLGLSQ